jgi:hypothetical protein
MQNPAMHVINIRKDPIIKERSGIMLAIITLNAVGKIPVKSGVNVLVYNMITILLLKLTESIELFFKFRSIKVMCTNKADIVRLTTRAIADKTYIMTFV